VEPYWLVTAGGSGLACCSESSVWLTEQGALVRDRAVVSKSFGCGLADAIKLICSPPGVLLLNLKEEIFRMDGLSEEVKVMTKLASRPKEIRCLRLTGEQQNLTFRAERLKLYR
jgi:hypothetical protein